MRTLAKSILKEFKNFLSLISLNIIFFQLLFVMIVVCFLCTICSRIVAWKKSGKLIVEKSFCLEYVAHLLALMQKEMAITQWQPSVLKHNRANVTSCLLQKSLELIFPHAFPCCDLKANFLQTRLCDVAQQHFTAYTPSSPKSLQRLLASN